MRSYKRITRVGVAGLAAICLCVFLATADISGQGTRRKRAVAEPTPTPPARPAAEAQVISRASDINEIELTPVPKPAETNPDQLGQAASENAKLIAELRARIEGLEAAKKNDQEEKQKRLLTNLDILNRAEQRSESLRKQYFDLMDKETTVKTKLDLIEMSIRPEAIEREVAFAGSLRPEALRDLRKKQLELERTNLQTFLTEIQRTKLSVEQNLQRSESLVERLRIRLEKEIDSALDDDPQH